MELKHTCKQCGGHIAYPDEATGQTVECPHCQASIKLGAQENPLGTIESDDADAPPAPASPSQKSSASAPRGPRKGGVILYLFKSTGVAFLIAVIILILLRSRGRGPGLMAMQLTIHALITLAGIGILCWITAPVMRSAVKWVEKCDVPYEYVYKTCFLIAFVVVVMLEIAGFFKVQRGLFLPLYFLVQASLTSYCLRISFGRGCLIALVMAVVYLLIGLMVWLILRWQGIHIQF